MHSEKLWRAIAVGLCAAVPATFYVAGDLADAFPGVLTLAPEQTAPAFGPPAEGEEYERASSTPLAPSAAAQIPPELGADLAARMEAAPDGRVPNMSLSYSVVDAATGEVIVASDDATARVPASTLKLLTASAALRSMDGDLTLRTTVALEGDTVYLIGTGDMTLTREKLAVLADQAAAAAAEGGPRPITVALDTSALPGGENPAWGDNGRAGGWVAPTAALAVDEGWLDPSPYGAKSADPAGDAARIFAELLRERGVDVPADPVAATAPAGILPTASVESAPLREIVQTTLLHSDNTLAELLAHLTARSRGMEATPANAALAVHEEIQALGGELGVDPAILAQVVIHDGSGLSPENRVPPQLLTAVLAEVASGKAPDLEPLLYDVPIGGLSGNLVDRFEDPAVAPARGVIRGKTGYLAGTAALAGVTALPDGRTVAFDILVHGFDGADALEARAAVDAVAAEIVETD